MISIALIVLISLFGFSLLILLCVNCVAKKFLNGDFTRGRTEEEIDQPLLEPEEAVEAHESQREVILKKYGYQKKEEDTASVGKAGTLLEKAKAYQQFSEKNAVEMMKENKADFAQNATTKLSLQYFAHSSCIVGYIQTLNGLYISDKTAPQSINFHIKMMPDNRFRLKTKWKPLTSCNILAISFTMGSVSENDLKTSKLNMRLYGRGGVFSRPKCHGECYVSLDELVGKEKAVEFTKNILPKASGNVVGGSSAIFMSDSETD